MDPGLVACMMVQAAWWMNLPGKTVTSRLLCGAKSVTTMVSKSVHGSLEKYSVLANPSTFTFSYLCHHTVSPAHWMFSFLFLHKTGLTEETSSTQYLNCSPFCRAGYGNVSGDLINTWRLCKPFTAHADNSQLASSWNFEAIFYVY